MKRITLLFSSILLTVYTNAQCNEPTNVELFQEPWGSEVFIHWDENGEDLWDFEYGESGFAPTGIPIIEDLSSSYFNVVYNIAETEIYIDFYVRADCGATTSDWVGPFTFYNHCFERVWGEFYVEEAFEDGFIPPCWTETSQGSPDTGVGLFGNSNWIQSDFSNDTSNSFAAKVNISGANVNEWLILPPMRGIEGLNYDPYHDLHMDFTIALTQENSTLASNLGSDDIVKLLISPDLGITWFTIMTWDKDSTISNTGETISIIYYDYTDGFGLKEQVFLVAFWASSGTVNDTENVDFFVDDVYAVPPATGSVVDLSSKGFSYYPNPSENTINITAKETIDQVAIFNNLGQKLKQVAINALSNQLDISDLQNGIYYMQVHIGNTLGVVPVVKN